MADENNQEPGTIRVKTINTDRQFTNEMTVQRLSVNTGDQKDAQSDAMREVYTATTDQTDTIGDILTKIHNLSEQQLMMLKDISKTSIRMVSAEKELNKSEEEHSDELKKSIDALRSAIVALTAQERSNSNGTDGETNGRGEGRSVGDAVAAARLFEKAIKELQKFIHDKENENITTRSLLQHIGQINRSFFNLLKSGVVEQVKANFLDLASKIQGFTKSLVESFNITNEVMKKFYNAVDIGKSGVANWTDVMFDFFPALIHGRDNLAQTMALVRTSIQDDLINPVGIAGDYLDGVAESFRQTRLSMRDNGVNAFDRLSWDNANAVLIQLLDLERRNSIQANLNDSLTRRNIESQLNTAQLIATNTGRTAEEVIKMNANRERELRDLRAAGGLNESDQYNFARAQEFFAARNMTSFAELIQGIGMSGGSLELFLAQNPELTKDLAVMQQLGTVRQLLETVRGGRNMNDINLGNALMGIATQFSKNPFTGIAGAFNLSDRGRKLAGEAGRTGTFVEDKEDSWMRLKTTLEDWRDNILPTGELKLIAALVANTAAVIANTAALLGGGGLLGGLWGGTKKAGGKAIGIGGKIIKGGAGLAAAGAGGLYAGSKWIGKKAGSSLLKTGGKSLLKKIPYLGVVVGAGLGANRAWAGDWSGARDEVLSGIAGMVPGPGTAASVALDAKLAATDLMKSKDNAIAPIQSTNKVDKVTPSVSPSIQSTLEPTPSQMLSTTNKFLKMLVDLMESDADVQKKIMEYTSKIGIMNQMKPNPINTDGISSHSE